MTAAAQASTAGLCSSCDRWRSLIIDGVCVDCGLVRERHRVAAAELHAWKRYTSRKTFR